MAEYRDNWTQKQVDISCTHDYLEFLNADQTVRDTGILAKIHSKRTKQYEIVIFGTDGATRLTRKLAEYGLEYDGTECISSKSNPCFEANGLFTMSHCCSIIIS